MDSQTVPQSPTALTDESREDSAIMPVDRAPASMNALKTGLAAQALLLPGESREEYAGTIAAWLETLRPANLAEGRLIARIADVDHRLQRLARVERKQLLAAVERDLAASVTAKELTGLRDLKAAVGGMARAAEETTASACGEAVKGIVPAIQTVLERLIAMRLPGPGTGELYRSKRILAEGDLESGRIDEAWKALGTAARAVEGELAEKVAEFERELEADREQLLEERVIGDDREAKRVARYRTALQKEMDHLLATLRVTRELAHQARDQAESPFCEPLTVDLRLLPLPAPGARLSSSPPASRAPRRAKKTVARQ